MREEIRKLKRILDEYIFRNINYRKLGRFYREVPIEPWAFIRVKNEIKTVKSSLESILPVIKKGVIGYHKLSVNEKDDGTIEYLKKFCEKNKGYKLFEYNYEVIPANDKRYERLDKVPSEQRLDSHYNAVLENIPKDEWLIKIDCDQIYDTEKLKKSLYLPKNEDDIISLGRFNLHYDNESLFYLKKDTLYDPGDHWILKNRDIHFEFKSGNKNGEFFAWESLIFEKKRKIYNTEVFSWHFPYIKSSRSISREQIEKFENFKLRWRDWLRFHISKDMCDKDKILNYLMRKNIL